MPHRLVPASSFLITTSVQSRHPHGSPREMPPPTSSSISRAFGALRGGQRTGMMAETSESLQRAFLVDLCLGDLNSQAVG